eukprot:CAMPEP_0114359552 /NCGR_PEP_ID=MMETSP0101-20121206/23107_1 /TAXON_ID=38822 ORGANISM="Pteridomonas danica, Strain PT" /NCGR_SAMPLE_ID=MMETSP0101 /ASSEMBLY_ACC=CAM_ASM_000211 /LENGTH=530 /DNA_ID=CAMNT_0001503161 /DNA_START=225 /DNA_END=1817 /DNA_ORIENTATION=+
MAKSEKQMLYKALAVFTVGACGSWLRTRCFGMISARVGKRLRRSLFKVILSQDTSFFDFDKENGGLGTAEMESCLGKDVDECTNAITSNFGNVLRFSSSAICGSIMVIRVGSTASTLRLACLGVSLLVAAVPASLLRKKDLDRTRGQHSYLLTASSERVLEKVRGIRTVVAFGREEFEAEAYGDMADSASRAEEQVSKAEAAYMGTLDLCLKGSTVCVAAYGSSLVRRGHLTAGQLTAFALYSSMAGMGLAGLLRSARSDWQSAAWRLLQILDRKKDQAGSGTGDQLSGPCRGHVKFENVGFAYASSAEPDSSLGPMILSNMDLEVKPGEAVVLMGPSGCGKSTTGRLLLGLYTPISGRITIDGVALTPSNASSLRSHMGVVEQDAPLWSCSVLENIRYGNLDATDSEVEEAARTANAHEFISSLAKGYKTVLGKGGLTLSGGQRQRLAIARAIVKKPPILLLDEATASLDADSETVVLDALKSAMKGRTVLAIAHNDATISQLANVIATMVPNTESKEGGCYVTSELAK